MVTTCSRSSSLSFCSPSASFSMSTALSRRAFFLEESLPRTPFASAEPESCRRASSSGLGLRKVCAISNRSQSSESVVATYHLVLGLVALGLEVEVVAERVLAALVGCCEDDGHVKLSPSLLFDAERRLLDCCTPVSGASSAGTARTHSLCLGLSKEGCRLYTAFS